MSYKNSTYIHCRDQSREYIKKIFENTIFNEHSVFYWVWNRSTDQYWDAKSFSITDVAYSHPTSHVRPSRNSCRMVSHRQVFQNCYDRQTYRRTDREREKETEAEICVFEWIPLLMLKGRLRGETMASHFPSKWLILEPRLKFFFLWFLYAMSVFFFFAS